MFVVYASFLVNVVIGLWLAIAHHRRISLATLLGAIQFFLVTISPSGNSSAASRTPPPLLACYIAGIPLFWNT